MTEMRNPQSGEPSSHGSAGMDAAPGDAVPPARSAGSAGKARAAILIGAVVAAATAALGIVAASTVEPSPAWRALIVSLSPGPPPKIVVWRDAAGAIRKAAVDPIKYDDLVAQQRKLLDAVRTDTRAAARTRIEADTAAVFSDIDDRIPQYGEWYYRYTTKYLLMAHGAMGFWHDFGRRPAGTPLTVAEAVQIIQNHLNSYLKEQYAADVLHPPDTEARLQNAYDRDLATLHDEWRTVIADENRRFAEFLDGEKSTIVPASDGQALDWDFYIGDTVHNDSVTVRKFRRGMLTIAITRPQKYVVPGAPTPEPEEDPNEDVDEISHVIVNLFSAIIDPLAAQISGLLAGTFAGGLAGAVTGGIMTVPVAAAATSVLSAPLVGAAIGAAITVSTDIASTRLEEHITRGAFEQNLRETLAKTQKEITDNLAAALTEHADSQFVEGSRHLGLPPTANKKPGAAAPPA